jgi:hypothetical protein
MRRRLRVCAAVVALGFVASALVVPATASAALRKYPCASGFVSASGNGPYGLGLGQSVDAVVKNNNVFGLSITVRENVFDVSRAGIVGPLSSRTFSFPAVFGAEPIGYSFSLSTSSSSIIAAFTFRSYFCGIETGQVKSGLNNKCMNLKQNDTADGTPVTIDTCGDAPRQKWTWGYTPGISGYDRTIRIHGKCLDNAFSGTANGNPVQLWTCNGTNAQRWESQPNGTLRNVGAGKCVTDSNAAPDGTQFVIWDCNQQPQQQWTLPVTTAFLP